MECFARAKGKDISWNSLLVMLFGRDSDLRIPTMPLPRSARCSRSAGDEAAHVP